MRQAEAKLISDAIYIFFGNLAARVQRAIWVVSPLVETALTRGSNYLRQS